MREFAGARSLEQIDWDTWRPVDRATLLFVVRDGRILLIRKKRGLGAGKINGPGGRLDPGETPLQAAAREVREEICVQPLDIHHHGELKFHFVDGYSIHVWVYRAGDFEGQPAETVEAEPLWFPLDRIPYEQMWADDVHWLPLLLEGRGFDGRFIFEGDAMLDHEIVERQQGEAPWSG
jgi:8-oxo-dGTP diphosphatase